MQSELLYCFSGTRTAAVFVVGVLGRVRSLRSPCFPEHLGQTVVCGFVWTGLQKGSVHTVWATFHAGRAALLPRGSGNSTSQLCQPHTINKERRKEMLILKETCVTSVG